MNKKKKFEKYFYEETGLYIDWEQLKKLPDIDTLIDIGVGTEGTPDLYNRFPNQKLVLIDPLEVSPRSPSEVPPPAPPSRRLRPLLS